MLPQICQKTNQTNQSKSSAKRCDFSEEAVSSGFDKFLNEVEDAYYRMMPYKIPFKKGATVDEIKKMFKPYNPSPKNLKYVTDTSMKLLQKVNSMRINMAKLKPREKKALFQVKHYLQFNFGTPYDGNYYAGDFLMGPNLFCWQPICSVSSQIRYSLRYYQPREVKDLETLRDVMALFNETYHQYIENLNYGIKAGMVRSVEECKAGYNAIILSFPSIVRYGPQG